MKLDTYLFANDLIFAVDEKNPLEERSDPTDDVEVFDQENKLWSGIDEEFAKIVRSEQEQSRREHELVEPMLREMDENIARHVIKEGPVLPGDSFSFFKKKLVINCNYKPTLNFRARFTTKGRLSNG